MKSKQSSDGRSRIFAKALQSTLGTSSARKEPVIMAPTIECRNLADKDGNDLFSATDPPILPPSQPTPGASYRENMFLEDNLLNAIEETILSVPTSDIDEWAKKNRLQALMKLKSNQKPLIPRINTDLNGGVRTQVIEKSATPKSHRPKELHQKSVNCCMPFIESNNIKNSKLPFYDAAPLKNLPSSTGFIDSHCHLDLVFKDEEFHGTYSDYIARHADTYPDSYKGCVTVFCKPWTFSKIHQWRKILEQPNVWGAFGCHPKQARLYNEVIEKQLERCLDHPNVRALGEIGLDYSKNNWKFKEEQHFAFKRQLTIARRRNLRVVIHCREADEDAIRIMKEILPSESVFHLHCFTGSWKKAQTWIQAFPNVRIGITNLVTFPSAVDTHEVAIHLPLNRLLLETDAPFFVPKMAPKGTKVAHPGMAIHAAAQIAALRKISVDKVLQATNANTRYVYNIP